MEIEEKEKRNEIAKAEEEANKLEEDSKKVLLGERFSFGEKKSNDCVTLQDRLLPESSLSYRTADSLHHDPYYAYTRDDGRQSPSSRVNYDTFVASADHRNPTTQFCATREEESFRDQQMYGDYPAFGSTKVVCE